MLIDEPTGALLFGANTEANRKRFWEASRVFHHLELTDPKPGRYVTMLLESSAPQAAGWSISSRYPMRSMAP